MRVTEKIQAWGHPHITGSHRTTFEVTRAQDVSPSGDCVIAVAASKGVQGLTPTFKRLARDERTRITVILEVDGLEERVVGWGHPSPNKAARNLSRSMIHRLLDPCQQIQLTFIAEQPY
jgi:hypothetical protein